jgi:hypothetical protein
MPVVYLSPVGNGYQFLSAAGVPLSGGLLHTYAAGTSTPQATYTTSVGNVQNANPIVLDASGRIGTGIWLTATTHDFVLKDSLGNPIQTLEDIAPTQTAASLTSSVGSSLIGFIHAAAAAVARTVQDKLRERVSVQDFGTLSAGADLATSTANAAIIQAAIDYLDGLGGGVAYLNGVDCAAHDLVGAANVILDGGSQGYGYSTTKSRGVIRALHGTWGFRTPVVTHPGLRNIALVSNGEIDSVDPAHPITTSGVEYGLVNYSGGTTAINVTVYGFQHNICLVNNGNANIYEKVCSAGSTMSDFAVTSATATTSTWAALTNYSAGDKVRPTADYDGYHYEVTTDGGSSGAAEPVWPTTPGDTVVDDGLTWTCRKEPFRLHHPNLPLPTYGGAVLLHPTTEYTVRDSNLSVGGWGVILRDGVGYFGRCVIESNWFGGLMLYVGDSDSSVSANFDERCHLEDNWRGLSLGASYTNDNNNLLLTSDGVPIAFTLSPNNAVSEVGFQLYAMSSKTGNVITNMSMSRSSISLAASPSNQKAMFLQSAYCPEFDTVGCSGGDQTNAVRLGALYCVAPHFYDYGGTLPAAGNMGDRGAHFVHERSAASGGLTALVGYFRGLAGALKFTAAPADDASTDFYTLDWYGEASTAGAVGFTVTLTGVDAVVTGTAYATRVGDTVTLDLPTLSGTSNTTSKTYTGIPAVFRPASNKVNFTSVSNNGAAYAMGLYLVQPSGVVYFTTDPAGSSTSWTAAGTCGIQGPSISYTVN